MKEHDNTNTDSNKKWHHLATTRRQRAQRNGNARIENRLYRAHQKYRDRGWINAENANKYAGQTVVFTGQPPVDDGDEIQDAIADMVNADAK